MVNGYIAWYLFLAGMGGSAFLIGATVDIALRRFRSERLERVSVVTDGGMYLGPVVVMLGLAFLLIDLGSPERAFQVFFVSSTSLLTLGSWAIALFLGSALLSLALSGASDAPLARQAEIVLHGAATLFSVCVIAYSGIYLSLFASVPFLHSALVPLLFVASALSTGMALLLLYGFVMRDRDDTEDGIAWCAEVDLALVAVEGVLLALFLALAWAQGGIARVSVEALVSGAWAELFWFGVVAIGIVVPLSAEVLHVVRSWPLAFAVGAGCSIVGGLCLRYALLLAAIRVNSLDMSAVTFWG